MIGCDTHVHVIGEAARYPMVEARHYTPGPASVAQLQAHLQRQGLDRAVIIQPSVYGTDNRCLLGALAEMKGAARGVAVPDRAVSAATLQAWHVQGVRGIRINLESAGQAQAAALAEELAHWAPRIAGLGWHVQVYAPLQAVVDGMNEAGALPVPVVLDHFALWNDIAAEAGLRQAVTDKLARGEVYIKLSASYRVTLAASELEALAQHWLQLRPDRLLWASDWPHTNREPGRHRLEVSAYRAIAAQQLVQEREGWLASPEARRQVLVDNPSRLYGFGP